MAKKSAKKSGLAGKVLAGMIAVGAIGGVLGDSEEPVSNIPEDTGPATIVETVEEPGTDEAQSEKTPAEEKQQLAEKEDAVKEEAPKVEPPTKEPPTKEPVVETQPPAESSAPESKPEPAPVPEEKPETPPQAQQPEPTTPVKPEEPVDLEQAFRDKLNQYNYVGSSGSDKYHKPSCRWTKEINDGNLVHFDTKEAAIAAGYTACGTCKPK